MKALRPQIEEGMELLAGGLAGRIASLPHEQRIWRS